MKKSGSKKHTVPMVVDTSNFNTLNDLMAGRKLSEVNGIVNRMPVDDVRRILRSSGLSTNGCQGVVARRLKEQARRLHIFTGDGGLYDPKSVPVFYDYLVVIDFECTCQEHTNAGFIPEIIEFPAILVDCATMTVADEFHAYCCPVLHQRLTKYCVDLTGITQDLVDSADPFVAVFADFTSWLKTKVHGKKYALVTDGPCDLAKFLYNQCKISNIPMPKFAHRWVNIKKIFSNFFDVGRMKLPEMMEFLGLEMKGRLHSGLSDARNIATLTMQLIHEGALIFPNERLIVDSPQTKIESIKREEFLKSNQKVRTSAVRSPRKNDENVHPSEAEVTEDSGETKKVVRSLAEKF